MHTCNVNSAEAGGHSCGVNVIICSGYCEVLLVSAVYTTQSAFRQVKWNELETLGRLCTPKESRQSVL